MVTVHVDGRPGYCKAAALNRSTGYEIQWGRLPLGTWNAKNGTYYIIYFCWGCI